MKHNNKRPLVLVVEDNAEINRYLCATLATEYTTAAAFNGKEGLEKALELHPTLILTDVEMPIMSGEQMFIEARKHAELAQVPIIVLTAKSDEEFRVKLLNEGVQDYITKPFLAEELRARVGNLVRARLAQIKLTLAEGKFRGLLETAADAMIIVDRDGTIELMNKQAERWFGYDRSELIGKPVEILIPHRYREKHVKLREAYSKHPEIKPMRAGADFFALRKDGTEFPVEISLSPLETEEEMVFTVAVRDITARKEIERQYRFQSDLSYSLAESIDYKTNINRLARLLVPEFADLCLIFSEGKNQIPELRAAAHRDPNKALVLEELLASLKPNADFSFGVVESFRKGKSMILPEVSELLLMAAFKDVEVRRLIEELGMRSCILVPIGTHGHTLGVLVVSYGESGRRFKDADLPFYEEVARRAALAIDKARLYSEAQDAIRTREEVLAIVSHDLKNPLAAISLNAQMLPKIETANEMAMAKLNKSASSVEKSVQHMEGMISSILDLAKIQAGTFSVEPKEENVESMVSAFIETMKPLAAAKNILLVVKIDTDLPTVFYDKIRATQVLSNLVGNAIKFTPKEGTVTIQIARKMNEVVFSVIDTGPGIPEEYLKHVFDRYWQAKETARLGTGLGLSIAKGIVEAHHGRIWAESIEGKGAKFFFTIPLDATRHSAVVA